MWRDVIHCENTKSMRECYIFYNFEAEKKSDCSLSLLRNTLSVERMIFRNYFNSYVGFILNDIGIYSILIKRSWYHSHSKFFLKAALVQFFFVLFQRFYIEFVINNSFKKLMYLQEMWLVLFGRIWMSYLIMKFNIFRPKQHKIHISNVLNVNNISMEQ